MKIVPKNFSWSQMSRDFTSSRALRKSAPQGSTVLRNTSVFHAFSPKMPSFGTRDEVMLKNIDLALLQEFAQENRIDALSYRGFISSQLQHEPVADNTKEALKRALAIKKMHSLVKTTVEEMRAIELRRISLSKG